MAAIKNPLAPDSAAELGPLVGDDATATFESDSKFIDSDPTGTVSSENVEVQRDTDDTEDSEEEEDEELEEDEDDEDREEDEELEDEEEDDEDIDEDEGEEEEDDEDEVGAVGIQATGSTNLRGPVVNGKKSVESALEENDDAGDESVEEDEYVTEGGGEEKDNVDNLATDRAVDAALRMSALVAATAQFAATV
jgi:hypothetical protein